MVWADPILLEMWLKNSHQKLKQEGHVGVRESLACPSRLISKVNLQENRNYRQTEKWFTWRSWSRCAAEPKCPERQQVARRVVKGTSPWSCLRFWWHSAYGTRVFTDTHFLCCDMKLTATKWIKPEKHLRQNFIKIKKIPGYLTQVFNFLNEIHGFEHCI